MSKEKAIELIREVKHSLFLIKSMLYIRDEDTLVEKMDLNIQNVIRYLKSWRIDYDKRRSETAIAYLGSLCRRKGN